MNTKTIAFTILLVFISSSSLADHALKPIDITLGEWSPFVSQDLEGYGEVTQKVTIILKLMGYRPNYMFMPWGQAEKLVQRNNQNTGPRGTFPFLKTDDRKDVFYYSEKPIFNGCMRFFYNHEKIKNTSNETIVLKTLTDLKDYNIGYVEKKGGYQYPKTLQKILDEKGTMEKSFYRLFKRMINNKDMGIQVVPALKQVGLDLLFESFPNKYKDIKIFKDRPKNEECLMSVDYYFILSKLNPENAEFIDKFNKQYEELDIGTIEPIEKKARQRPSLREPAVTLTTDSSVGFIKGYDGDVEYLLPRGTKGRLLSWERNKENKSSVDARVYILTGPYRGKEVRLDGQYVELQ